MEFSNIRDDSARNDRDQRETIEVKVVDGDPLLLRVAGRVLYDTMEPLVEALSRLDPAAEPRVVLDMSEVPMCDSSALNLLVRSHKQLSAAGGWLRLAGVQPLVSTVLKVTNLTRVLAVHPSVEDAVAAQA